MLSWVLRFIYVCLQVFVFRCAFMVCFVLRVVFSGYYDFVICCLLFVLYCVFGDFQLLDLRLWCIILLIVCCCLDVFMVGVLDLIGGLLGFCVVFASGIVCFLLYK